MRANAIQLRLKAGPHYEHYRQGVAARVGAVILEQTTPGGVQ